MSFSSDIKQELNKNNKLANKKLVKYELIGYLISGNIDMLERNMVRFSTGSDYNINRFSKLLTNLDINHKIDILGKNFSITFKATKVEDFVDINAKKIRIKEEIKYDKNEEELKAIIIGVFMGSGSVNNPEKKYHLEIDFKEEVNLRKVKKILENFGIEVKTMNTENKKSLYLKDGEDISKLLALIGANKAVMQFEDIRIQKEMRGKVNRLVNCKSANLNKTINASIEQIAAIKKLKDSGKFSRLSDNLKEIAELRVENPDMSLLELGKKLSEPVGKSGVNYRLKKIMEIANE